MIFSSCRKRRLEKMAEGKVEAQSSVCERFFKKAKELVLDYSVTLHVPNFTQCSGMGVVTPIMPIFARQLGANDAIIGTIVSAIGIGKVIFDVPGSILTHEYSVRVVMIGATFIFMAGALLAFVAPTAILLFLSAVLWGGSMGVFFTSRHHFLADAIPKETRGRLFSMLGGGQRWALVLGPMLGGYLTEAYGPRLATLATIPILAVAAVCIIASTRIRQNDAKQLRERAAAKAIARAAQGDAGGNGSIAGHRTGVIGHFRDLFDTIVEHRKPVISVGIFASMIIALRMCRRMFLPLAAMNLNLPASQVGLILSYSFLVDASLFWIGGIIIDRLGRKMAAIPTAILMGCSFLLLSRATNSLHLALVALFWHVGRNRCWDAAHHASGCCAQDLQGFHGGDAIGH